VAIFLANAKGRFSPPVCARPAEGENKIQQFQKAVKLRTGWKNTGTLHVRREKETTRSAGRSDPPQVSRPHARPDETSSSRGSNSAGCQLRGR